ncbi:MAG: hypothetical protein KGL39_38865 [Patescibacteria group bacterium]|nr:hypothetical protein [Patescibacteria group bacterium]
MTVGVTTPSTLRSSISQNYLGINNSLTKAPVYIVSFGPITGPLGTNFQPLANEYSTGYVQQATKTRPNIMTFPSGYSSEFNPVTYQSTLSNITFDLLDNHPQWPGEATTLVTNYLLKNRWVVIRRGFYGLNESDFTVIYMGQINNFQFNKTRTGYTFEIFDARKQLTATVADGHTTLTSAYTVGNTSIVCNNVTGFATQTQPTNTNSTVKSYLRMGSALYSYTGVTNGGGITDGTAVWLYVQPGGFTQPNPLLQVNSVVVPTNDYSANGQNWNAKGSSCGSTLPYASSGETLHQFFDTGNGAFFTWDGYDTSSYVQWIPNTAVVIGRTCSNFGNRYVCVVAGTTGPIGGPAGNGGPGGSFTGLVFGQPDSQGASSDANAAIGASVDNVIGIQGHPIDIILGILLSTGTGLNNPTNTPAPSNVPLYQTSGLANYDVNPSNAGAPGSSFGIGIPWWQVNIPNFVAQKALMGGLYFVGYFQNTELALKFIENYLLEQSHLGLFTNRNGQVDCKAITAPTDMTNAVTLDQTNIIGQPQFSGNLQTNGYFYNETFISYDYQLVQGYYASIDAVQNVPSLNNYQEESQIQVDGRFFNTSAPYYLGASMSSRCSTIYLARFSNPPPLIVCDVFDMFTLLNPFDPVILNHPNVPNYLTGGKGGSIDCQVVKVEPNWANGSMKVTLMAIGWYLQQSHPSPRLIISSNYTVSSNQTAQGLVYIYPGVLLTINQGAVLTITPS